VTPIVKCFPLSPAGANSREKGKKEKILSFFTLQEFDKWWLPQV
jgi:hypothetical protein